MGKIAIQSWGIISELGSTEKEILDAWDQKNNIWGEELQFEHELELRKIRRMGRLAKMAACVTDSCLKNGGGYCCDKTGIIMNTDYGPINLNIEFGKVLETPELSSPMDFANTVSNAALGHVALYFGLKGTSTLLMGSNAVSCAIRQIEKKEDEMMVVCGGDEYCQPIAGYAEKKWGQKIVSEGVAAVMLAKGVQSEWGYIIGCAQAGMGFSPLYENVRDVKENYKSVMEKVLTDANLLQQDIELVIMSSDKCSGIREYEDAAVSEVFRDSLKRAYIKDAMGENFGAATISSIIAAAVLIKNRRYSNILVLGTEVSGTLEAYIVSQNS